MLHDHIDGGQARLPDLSLLYQAWSRGLAVFRLRQELILRAPGKPLDINTLCHDLAVAEIRQCDQQGCVEDAGWSLGRLDTARYCCIHVDCLEGSVRRIPELFTHHDGLHKL